MKLFYFAATLLLTALTAQATAAPLTAKMCVFDPLGAKGSLFSTAKDYANNALAWGVKITPKAYVDEKIAMDDFKAGQCEVVLLTGARARAFNSFTATIEAVGAIPNIDVLRTTVKALAGPKAAKYMRQGKYEVAGIMPAGPIYLFVKDKKIDTVEELSGKRIATLDYDDASIHLVNHVGAALVPSNSANFSGKFNNGSVDVIYAPAVAYAPLELYRGLKDQGGIIRYVLTYMDFQIVINAEKMPKGFGQKSRSHVVKFFDQVNGFAEQEMKAIDDKYWIDLPKTSVDKYNQMLQKVRITLREKGIYNGKMLTLLRKLRCRQNPAEAECTARLE